MGYRLHYHQSRSNPSCQCALILEILQDHRDARQEQEVTSKIDHDSLPENVSIMRAAYDSTLSVEDVGLFSVACIFIFFFLGDLTQLGAACPIPTLLFSRQQGRRG